MNTTSVVEQRESKPVEHRMQHPAKRQSITRDSSETISFLTAADIEWDNRTHTRKQRRGEKTKNKGNVVRRKKSAPV
jgi:hypothetical protein